MGVKLARIERSGLCDALLETGPDAPTLCEGWTTHDLALHLWQREADPISAAGMFVAPLRPVAARRTAELRARWSFAELVYRLRSGPVWWSPFSLPGVDELANSVEFFVHHEDIRRAQGDPTPRQLPAGTQDLLWKRLTGMSKMLLRPATVGIVLERENGESIHARAGNPIVTIVGEPAELLLYASGRTSVAQVRLVGDDEGLAALKATRFGF